MTPESFLPIDLAVVGAGMAGLATAAQARDLGLNVIVLEKSKGLGGRCATRRIEDVPVDYGAQFFTVRSPEFQEKVQQWLQAGICREWSRGFPIWRHGSVAEELDGHPRYACPGGMTALAKFEAAGIEVRRSTLVTSLSRRDGLWELGTESGTLCGARSVILTAPAPQTSALVQTAGITHLLVKSLGYLPCLTGIYEMSGDSFPWKALRCEHPDVEWIANDATRRDGPVPSRMVLQATPEFSSNHLDRDPVQVMAELLPTLVDILGVDTERLSLLQAHRWRYARVAQGLPCTHLSIAENLWFAGDAFGLGNVEGAWLSGRAAAKELAV